MMRKLFLSLICMAALLLLPSQAMAEETVIKEAAIDVKIKYTEADLEYAAELGSGNTITLPDGTTVKVTGSSEADSGIQAVVVPVTEKDEADAYAYAESMTQAYGTDSYVFYILFYKDGKEVTPSGDVTVTVTPPAGYADASWYTFTGADTAASKLAVQTAGAGVSFSVSGSCYVSLVNAPVTPTTEPESTPTTEPETTPTETQTETTTEAAAETTETTSETSGSGSGNSGGNTSSGSGKFSAANVETGDETRLELWLMLLVVSAVALLIMGKKYRQEEK